MSSGSGIDGEPVENRAISPIFLVVNNYGFYITELSDSGTVIANTIVAVFSKSPLLAISPPPIDKLTPFSVNVFFPSVLCSVGGS